MFKKFLKRIIPDFVQFQWGRYNKTKEKHRISKLEQKIINYLEHIPSEDMTDDKREILDYLKHNSISVFPYFYTEKYKHEDVVVNRDNDKGMYYVLQDGKRLYFKKDWDEKQIQIYYNGLLMEQDIASPHRYETSNFHVSEGDVVVDAGVAEGNFALSIIEKVKKIYLFEVDEAWVSALEITFAPWKEKVIIVNKYVSDTDKDNNITLDTFLENERIDFIKADIEGAEPQLLAGAKKILSGQDSMKVVLCTYHKHNDATALNRMLVEKGFSTEFSKGYMIFLYDKFLGKPFLRKGLIRAIKN
jgi:hypothetical protein